MQTANPVHIEMRALQFPFLLLFHLLLLVNVLRTNAQTQPEDAYRGCEFPPIDWAVHSSGRSGSFWARDAHVAGNHLFAAGDFRSTDPDDVDGVEENNYEVTGPFTKEDRSGLDGTTIKASVQYQSGTSQDRRYDNEIGMNVIDVATGEPLEVIHFPSFHADITYTVGGSITTNGSSIVSMGGQFTGDISLPETKTCTSFTDGIVSVTCQIGPAGTFATTLKVDLEAQNLSPEDIEDTIVMDAFGFSAWLLAMEVNPSTVESSWNGMSVKWAISPWHGSWSARVHKTSVDSATGDVLAGGDACNGDIGAETPINCVGWVGRFSSTDGSVIWRKQLDGHRRIFGIDMDTEDGLVFFTAADETMGRKIVGCLSSSDGSIIWSRSFNEKKKSLTMTGEIKVAKREDGPFVYAVHSTSTASNSLDQGTPYAACLDSDGTTKIPSYEATPDKLLVEADCIALGYTYISTNSEDAIPPEQLPTGVACGYFGDERMVDLSCIMKFHKYTGQPQWSTPVVETRGMETSPDGPMITGLYNDRRGSFAGVNLPDFGASNTIFHALLDKDTGEGRYVQAFFNQKQPIHAEAAAMDSEGNFYIAARSLGAGIQVGSDDYSMSFPTRVDNSNIGSHNHLLVIKVLTAPGIARITPKCLICSAEGLTSTIREAACYVDQVCYEDGESALEILGDAGMVCDASVSQTELQELAESDDTCNVCGEGGIMTNPTGLFDASAFGFGDVECSLLDQLGSGGSLPDTGLSCADLAVILTEACGCEQSQVTAAPVAAPTTTDPIVNTNVDSRDLSPGAIAGIVIGSLVLVVVVVAAVSGKFSGTSSSGVEFDSSSPAIMAHTAAKKNEESEDILEGR